MKVFKGVLIAVFLLSLLSLTGCGSKKEKTKPLTSSSQKESPEEEKLVSPEEKVQFVLVNLYFVNGRTERLAVEKRQVFDLKDQTSMIKQVLRSLKLGPVGNLKPSIPENIEFKNIFIYKDTVYIDLKITNTPSTIGGIRGEKLFLASVVKTVCSLSDNYKKVVFLVNGEQKDSILGHIDSSGYFTVNSFGNI